MEMARCQDWRAREMSLGGICGGGGGGGGGGSDAAAGKKAQAGRSQQRVDTGQEKKTTSGRGRLTSLAKN